MTDVNHPRYVHPEDGHPLSNLYVNTLKSERWAKVRSAMADLTKGRCERCDPYAYVTAVRGGARPPTAIGRLEVHHLHYGTLGRERPQDVAILCPACHERAHRERRCNNMLRAWLAMTYGQDWHQRRRAVPPRLLYAFADAAARDGGGLLPIMLALSDLGWTFTQWEAWDALCLEDHLRLHADVHLAAYPPLRWRDGLEWPDQYDIDGSAAA